jgi:hypothetical protein
MKLKEPSKFGELKFWTMRKIDTQLSGAFTPVKNRVESAG